MGSPIPKNQPPRNQLKRLESLSKLELVLRPPKAKNQPRKNQLPRKAFSTLLGPSKPRSQLPRNQLPRNQLPRNQLPRSHLSRLPRRLSSRRRLLPRNLLPKKSKVTLKLKPAPKSDHADEGRKDKVKKAVAKPV